MRLIAPGGSARSVEHPATRTEGRTMRNRATALAAVLVTIAAWTSCGDSTGPGASVTVRFRTGSSVVSAGRLGSPASFSVMGTQDIVVTGSNGTLTITDIRLIVDELELEAVETTDCQGDEEQAGCEEFETGPLATQVPVDGTPVTVTSDQIPPGTYDELEFEVEDAEVDDGESDDAGESQALADLLATLRQTYPDWPDNASMVVVGTFTPTGGTAQPFRAYFAAELEVEMPIDPPLVIDAGNHTLTVQLHSEAWFVNPDGTVKDLSQFDFPTTGQVV